MGERWLKTEEEVIRELYPTTRRFKIQSQIPDRTWLQIGVKARKMRVLRTSAAKGQSVREGRGTLKNAYSFSENILFDRMYPTATHAALLMAFPKRTLKAIQSHAQKRHRHRTKEARAIQMKIGREEARERKEKKERWAAVFHAMEVSE